eukprot:GHVU01193473.1.p2 GENE.GHVU01193473.1~~GHVU01193473.1.p2  ORF type:complete len:129 (+),score=9.17 GHVU01193473.1:592-978(+)
MVQSVVSAVSRFTPSAHDTGNVLSHSFANVYRSLRGGPPSRAAAAEREREIERGREGEREREREREGGPLIARAPGLAGAPGLAVAEPVDIDILCVWMCVSFVRRPAHPFQSMIVINHYMGGSQAAAS